MHGLDLSGAPLRSGAAPAGAVQAGGRAAAGEAADAGQPGQPAAPAGRAGRAGQQRLFGFTASAPKLKSGLSSRWREFNRTTGTTLPGTGILVWVVFNGEFSGSLLQPRARHPGGAAGVCCRWGDRAGHLTLAAGNCFEKGMFFQKLLILLGFFVFFF